VPAKTASVSGNLQRKMAVPATAAQIPTGSPPAAAAPNRASQPVERPASPSAPEITIEHSDSASTVSSPPRIVEPKEPAGSLRFVSQRRLVLAGVAAAVVIGFVLLGIATSGNETERAKPEPEPIQTSSSLKGPAAKPQPKPAKTTAAVPAATTVAEAGAKPSASGSDQAESSKADNAGTEPAADGSAKVKVTTEPRTAIVFRGSQRLGEGEVTVEVPKGEKMSVVVLHRGYNYRRVKIDGSKSEVVVRLLKIPESNGEEE